MLQASLDSLLKIGITSAILRILGKRPLRKDVLINFAKGAEIASLICFITFVGMLLGPVLILILRSEIVRYLIIGSGCDEKVSLFGFRR